MRVVVWNQYKVDMDSQHLTQNKDESNYDFLLRVEENGALSSVITVNDKHQLLEFIEATHQETDVELQYQIIDDNDNPIIEEAENTLCEA